MPRNNRFTSKSVRSTQRSKRQRLGERALIHTMNPRPDERGASDLLALVIGGLALGVLVFGLLFAWYLPSSDGAVNANVVATSGSTPGKVVRLEPAKFTRDDMKNPALYVEHVMRRWHYVELVDGSVWMVTRCPQEDSDNCYWNARARGNGVGHSFVMIHGVKHWVRTEMQP